MAAVSNELITLQRMQVTSWLCLAVLCLGAGIFFSWFIAWSVLAGGIVSILSYWLSHRDVELLVSRITRIEEPEGRKARVKPEKSGYLLKFWVRIVIIGVVLLFLIKYGMVNIFGLILGLSTVVFAITFTALNGVRHYFFSGRR